MRGSAFTSNQTQLRLPLIFVHDNTLRIFLSDIYFLFSLFPNTAQRYDFFYNSKMKMIKIKKIKLFPIKTLQFLAVLCFSNGYFINNSLAQTGYVSLGDAPKKALSAYENAVFLIKEKNPDDPKKNKIKAEKYFQKAIEISPNFIDARWNFAEFLYYQKRYAEAKKEFERVVILSETYKPQTYFTLGLLEEQEKNWQKAAENFRHFLQLKRDPLLFDDAKKRADYCDFRKNAYANPVPFSPKNMGDSINTANDEYLPSLSLDGNTLIYTVMVTLENRRSEDFYISQYKGDHWNKAENMGEPINTPRNEGAQTISANGKTIVFSACNRPEGVGKCDFYISDFKNNKWTEPKNLEKPVNTVYWEGHSSLSADGKTLYFSTDRPVGEGEEDIWLSTRNADGTWAYPLPLPTSINTPYRESSPFIHADGVTLYFSSDGLAGMGKSDIFVTRKDSAGNWSKPINLGYPINTEGRDWSLIVAPDGKTAIYSAQRPDSHGGVDLYTFTLPDYARAIPTTFVRGVIRDAATKLPIANAICNLTDLKTQKTTTEIKTDSSGSFLMPLPTDRNYAFNASAKNYLFYSDNFSLKGLFSSEKPYEIVAFLKRPVKEDPMKNTPIAEKTGSAIVLKNVFFNASSYELLPESFGELNRLVDLLNDNPAMKIQINGHTDRDGGEKANLILSEKRTISVRDYLIRMGISAERLTTKGYGETQLLDTSETPEGKARNRRTEFIVL